MNSNERDYTFYLEDIVASMKRVQDYIQGLDFKRFKQDYKTVDAVIRNFEIIGEASKNLPKELKDRYPDVPWKEMYRLRNRAIHEYFTIDYEIIWDIATRYLPKNLEDLIKILDSERE